MGQRLGRSTDDCNVAQACHSYQYSITQTPRQSRTHIRFSDLGQVNVDSLPPSTRRMMSSRHFLRLHALVSLELAREEERDKGDVRARLHASLSRPSQPVSPDDASQRSYDPSPYPPLYLISSVQENRREGGGNVGDGPVCVSMLFKV
jgi:hypothetical protein